jgi:UDP-N-acetylglucosamine 2-epimerase (non-hydrolysing)
MKRSELVLTDSGGIQEEAPGLQVPVLVMRDKTERPEGLATGLVSLVGTTRARIVDSAMKVLTSPAGTRPFVVNPYGDGHAAERIVKILLERSTLKRIGQQQTDTDAAPLAPGRSTASRDLARVSALTAPNC